MNAPTSANAASTVLRGATIVTCDSEHRVIEGDLVIEGREIKAIGPNAAASAPIGARVIDVQGRAIIPGFVQAHVHLVQALFRGIAEERPLLEWLKDRIWPLESAHDESSLKASAELGLTEMIRAGTTTILDMGTVHGHDTVMDTCERSGIRAFSGKCMMDQGKGFPKRMHESRRESVRESVRLAETWSGKATVASRTPSRRALFLSCSEALMRETAEAAAERDMIVHTHAAEHAAERKAVKEILGKDDIDALASYGITGPRAVLAHGVQLRPAEIRKRSRGHANHSLPECQPQAGLGYRAHLEHAAVGLDRRLGCRRSAL
ncbi:MAG: amidohydrolase family protein [Polyangiaceae bacterium]